MINIRIAKLRGSKSLDFLFEKFRLGKQNQRESNPNHQCSVPFLPPGVQKEIEQKILGTLKKSIPSRNVDVYFFQNSAPKAEIIGKNDNFPTLKTTEKTRFFYRDTKKKSP